MSWSFKERVLFESFTILAFYVHNLQCIPFRTDNSFWEVCGNLRSLIILTHFSQMFSFYTPRKPLKTSGFSYFLVGIEREHWSVKGYLEIMDYRFFRLRKCTRNAMQPFVQIPYVKIMARRNSRAKGKWFA